MNIGRCHLFTKLCEVLIFPLDDFPWNWWRLFRTVPGTFSTRWAISLVLCWQLSVFQLLVLKLTNMENSIKAQFLTGRLPMRDMNTKCQINWLRRKGNTPHSECKSCWIEQVQNKAWEKSRGKKALQTEAILTRSPREGGIEPHLKEWGAHGRAEKQEVHSRQRKQWPTDREMEVTQK